jgi:hypothetical protein
MKVLFILFLVVLTNTQFLDDKALQDLVKELSEVNNMGTAEYVYFFRIRPEKRSENVNYFVGVFRKFLPSINVRGDVYNWGNHDIIVVTKHNIEVDFILDHMSDWIDKGGVHNSSDFKKKEENNDL